MILQLMKKKNENGTKLHFGTQDNNQSFIMLMVCHESVKPYEDRKQESPHTGFLREST